MIVLNSGLRVVMTNALSIKRNSWPNTNTSSYAMIVGDMVTVMFNIMRLMHRMALKSRLNELFMRLNSFV